MCAVMQTGVVPSELRASRSAQGGTLDEVRASVPFVEGRLYHAVPLVINASQGLTRPDSQESGIDSMPSDGEDSFSLLSEDRQSLASTDSQLSFASESTEEWYGWDSGENAEPLTGEGLTVDANKLLPPEPFFDADKPLPPEPVQEGVWKKRFTTTKSWLSWGKDHTVSLLKSGGEKLYQAGVWACQEIGDRCKVRTARHKAIDKVLDHWVRYGLDEPLQDTTYSELVVAKVMRQKIAQPTQVSSPEEMLKLSNSHFESWECVQYAVKTSLGLVDEKKADSLKQAVPMKRMVKGLLERLNRDNQDKVQSLLKEMATPRKLAWRDDRPHWHFSWCKMSARKKASNYLVKGLKRQTSWFGLQKKCDAEKKNLIIDLTDRLSEALILDWDQKTEIYQSWGIEDCPHYTVELTKIVDGVPVTEL